MIAGFWGWARSVIILKLKNFSRPSESYLIPVIYPCTYFHFDATTTSLPSISPSLRLYFNFSRTNLDGV